MLPLLPLLLLLVLALPAPAEARDLRLGFLDAALQDGDARVRATWLDRAAGLGADDVRIGSGWATIAPTRPARPEDPADAAYRWIELDAAAGDAAARGLRINLTLTGAPAWAEGPGRPESAQRGTWRPDSAAYGRFAVAVATRYSGRYPDPSRPGAVLPRIDVFQPWNEPNLDRYLTPQWTRRNGRWRTASPRIYRGLLNAFARAVKAVDRRNLVVAGGTAPFGDLDPGGERLPPARFIRELLSARTVFDVLAHHPYSVRGPFGPALNTDDVSVPDLAKLTKPLRRAERAGRISPSGRKRLWVTELSWDSSPPDPRGVKEARHARWLSEGLYVLWRQGVDAVTWFQIRDQAPEPSFAETYQSGVYLRSGRPKLAARAYAFPFVVRRRAGRTRIWLRSPAAGKVIIERRAGGAWRPVLSLDAERHQVIERRVDVRRRVTMRARLGDTTSLPYP